jgi:hypothetical protein
MARLSLRRFRQRLAMDRLRTKVALVLVGAWLCQGCTDSCRQYSDYSCAQLEKKTYNVWVYPPSGSEYSAGKAVGLEACGSQAWSYAQQRGFDRDRDWSYVCCLETKDSSCAEKHR